MRWFFFCIVVLIGIAGGLFYGWMINPVKYVDTTPDSLSIDYRTDYVLMVAEAYSNENDLQAAVRRLAMLGDTPPIELMQQAMIYGAQNSYAEADLGLMSRLASALQTWNPALGGQSP
jgi:hypothetical protein